MTLKIFLTNISSYSFWPLQYNWGQGFSMVTIWISSFTSTIKVNENGSISEMFVNGHKNMKRGNDNLYVYSYTICNILNYDCDKANLSNILQFLLNLTLKNMVSRVTDLRPCRFWNKLCCVKHRPHSICRRAKALPNCPNTESRGNDVSLFGVAYRPVHISGHHKAVECITNRFVIIS